MAYVSSMTYTTEAQFLEAVAQARAAQTIRQEAQIAALQQNSGMSFQEILNSSLSGQVNSSAVSYNSCENAYDEFFQKAADTYHISVDLLKAVAKQESGFHSNIVSSAGAIGIMQLMPSTAEYLGVTNPYDPEQNIMGGAKLLSELYERYNGNLDFTLAAYNAGAGSVDNYGGVPPYSETQNFITKVKSYMGIS